jgi:4-hydroxy-tetrahydrodipicolinate reductase
MKAALVGYGRMGRALELVLEESGHQVVARLDVGDDLAPASTADVAFEFTQPSQAAANVTRLIELGVPVVCGTTAWDTQQAARLAESRRVPLLVAPNFSIGVAVLRALVREAAERLKAFPEFEPGIFERHHSKKLDAPSGTAKLLAGAVAASGRAAPPVVALRQGGVTGEHQVIFEGPDEGLEMIHRAHSRRIFALGAVRAAEWLVRTRPAGLVSFESFLEGGGR